MNQQQLGIIDHADLFERLIENISDSVIITGDIIDAPYGPKILFVNQAFMHMTGYSESEAIGKTPRMLQGPKTSRDVLNNIHHALSRNQQIKVELVNYTKQGEEFIIEMEIIPVHTSDGKIYFIAIQRDITDRVIREQQIYQANVLNQRLFESSPDCLKMLDKNGKLEHMNLNGCKLMEIDDFEDVRNLTWTDLWPETVRPIVVESVQKAKSGQIYHFQAECPTAKGTPKWWDVLVTPVFNNNNEVEKIISSSRDITELKEEENRKLEFLKLVSHELKTPLTSIKGYAQLLLDNGIDDNDIGEMSKYALERIDSQVNRLTKLIGELLDISRIHNAVMTIQPTDFSYYKLVSRTIHDLRRSYPNRQIILHGDTSATIYADEDKIGQVIINLVNNALKFSKAEEPVTVTIIDNDTTVEISVTDSGIGIAPEDMDKLFHKFYQVNTQNKSGGFGIGLYLCKEILRLHQSTLSVTSTLGIGSTFSFSLPKK